MRNSRASADTSIVNSIVRAITPRRGGPRKFARPSRADTVWARWMVIARRAAEIQAHVLFFLLYVLAVVPLGLLQPRSRHAFIGKKGARPEWRSRESHAVDLPASRQQY